MYFPRMRAARTDVSLYSLNVIMTELSAVIAVTLWADHLSLLSLKRVLAARIAPDQDSNKPAGASQQPDTPMILRKGHGIFCLHVV